jgi:glucosamine-6-phosphate deaminase
LGGIGFFLGGIGPDGHIGFNVSGSDLHSTTRLMPTNYPTQAAAAGDLGGIEVSKKRLVITIGLATITYNPQCVAIIIAAGEAKARIVANAIQEPEHIRYPATVLQNLEYARFYITFGAAKHLTERQQQIFVRSEKIVKEQIDKIVIDLALSCKKKIHDLTKEDFTSERCANHLLQRHEHDVKQLTHQVQARLKQRIDAGMRIHDNRCFLHTEPHHDDVMLGYLPYVVRHIREKGNHHHFVTLTSGFTAVTNHFMMKQLKKLKAIIARRDFDALILEGYFEPQNIFGKNRDVWQYLDGVAANSEALKDEGQLRRMLRNLVDLYDETDLDNLIERIDELMHYFKTQYPGKKDLEHIQRLKGMCREWEGDCLWGYFGWHSESVHHLRLGFYKGDIFTEEPTVDRDVLPVVRLLESVKPDSVGVALDPEASGPDTHYKVLQAISEALKIYQKSSGKSDIEIIGYRNVWYRFHPSEADIMVPVSLNMFALQDNAFKNSFVSQKDASFPSYEYDGPFSELAQQIQVEQYQMLKTCLGREFFNEHPSALMRATRGMVYLKRMTLANFYERSRELKKSTENL